MHLVKIVGKASVPSLKQTTPISSVLVCTVENSRKKKSLSLKGQHAHMLTSLFFNL